MFDLFKKQSTRVILNDDGMPNDQHGIVVARNPKGEVVELGFRVDRPEVLIAGDRSVIENVFEQLGRQGYIPRRMEVACLGHRASYDAPKAAQKLESLQFS
jgi:hypothetical protein